MISQVKFFSHFRLPKLVKTSRKLKFRHQSMTSKTIYICKSEALNFKVFPPFKIL